MVIIMPHGSNGFKKEEEEIQSLDLENLEEKTCMLKVSLELPKFKLEQSIELNPILEQVDFALQGGFVVLSTYFSCFNFQLGIKDLFRQDVADLSGITPKNDLYISKAIQKTFFLVNEEGAEAAAATGNRITHFHALL